MMETELAASETVETIPNIYFKTCFVSSIEILTFVNILIQKKHFEKGFKKLANMFEFPPKMKLFFMIKLIHVLLSDDHVSTCVNAY